MENWTAEPLEGSLSATEAVRRATASARLVIVSVRTLTELVQELGTMPAVSRWLEQLATQIGRPIAVNVPTPTGSETVVIGPPDWSDERLGGWAAAHHAELEQAFGPARFGRPRPNRQERRKQKPR